MARIPSPDDIRGKRELTAAIVGKAVRCAIPGGERFDVTDSRTRGLHLRVSPRGVRWAWRTERQNKTTRLDLAPHNLLSVEEARRMADEATDMLSLRYRMPDENWVRSYLERVGKLAPLPLQETPSSRAAVKWTFAFARQQYLDGCLRSKRKATYDDYRKTLGSKDLRDLDPVPVWLVNVDDLQRRVNEVAKDGREATAEGIVRKIKPFFKWLAEPGRRTETHVRGEVMRALSAPPRINRELRRLENQRLADEGLALLPSNEADGYVPSPVELGRLLAIARSGALDIRMSAAIELLTHTALRRRAIVSARVRDILVLSDEREAIWSVPPPHMKTRRENLGLNPRPHALPLPENVLKAVRRAVDSSKSPYLFPAFRPRRENAPVGHVDPSTLTHTLAALPGILTTPQGVRRAFTTHGESLLGMSRSETKMILDHTEGFQGDVTENHYALHQRVGPKWKIMDLWSAFMERQCALAIEAEARLLDIGWLQAEIAAGRQRDAEASAERMARKQVLAASMQLDELSSFRRAANPRTQD